MGQIRGETRRFEAPRCYLAPSGERLYRKWTKLISAEKEDLVWCMPKGPDWPTRRLVWRVSLGGNRKNQGLYYDVVDGLLIQLMEGKPRSWFCKAMWLVSCYPVASRASTRICTMAWLMTWYFPVSYAYRAREIFLACISECQCNSWGNPTHLLVVSSINSV